LLNMSLSLSAPSLDWGTQEASGAAPKSEAVSWSALLGETERIPVSRANEPARRNPVWGNRQSRTETNAGRGQAITPSSAAVPS
jgi:hypothetical protein